MAIAVVTPTDGERGDARAVAASVLSPEVQGLIPVLGKGEPIDAGYGRGADGWVAVIEWAVQATVAGIIGSASWDLLKLQARQLKALVSRLRGDDVQLAISRGSAALIAIAWVLDEYGEDQVLDVEAAKEPSVIAGRGVTEISYLDFEPWLVFLVNESRTLRYVVAVSATGEVLNGMRFPMGQFEDMYGALPPRDGT